MRDKAQPLLAVPTAPGDTRDSPLRVSKAELAARNARKYSECYADVWLQEVTARAFTLTS